MLFWFIGPLFRRLHKKGADPESLCKVDTNTRLHSALLNSIGSLVSRRSTTDHNTWPACSLFAVVWGVLLLLTLIKDQYTGRWAHLNVKLLHFLTLFASFYVPYPNQSIPLLPTNYKQPKRPPFSAKIQLVLRHIDQESRTEISHTWVKVHFS